MQPQGPSAIGRIHGAGHSPAITTASSVAQRLEKAMPAMASPQPPCSWPYHTTGWRAQPQRHSQPYGPGVFIGSWSLPRGRIPRRHWHLRSAVQDVVPSRYREKSCTYGMIIRGSRITHSPSSYGIACPDPATTQPQCHRHTLPEVYPEHPRVSQHPWLLGRRYCLRTPNTVERKNYYIHKSIMYTIAVIDRPTSRGERQSTQAHQGSADSHALSGQHTASSRPVFWNTVADGSRAMQASSNCAPTSS